MPAKAVSTTIPRAGSSTRSTGLSRPRPTKGPAEGRRAACTMFTMQEATRMVASQKGTKPLWGPSLPQADPMRTESKRTSAPRARMAEAVAMSAARIPSPRLPSPRACLLLRQQPALLHQVSVKLLVLLHPGDVLGAGREGRPERAVGQVLLELRRLVDL